MVNGRINCVTHISFELCSVAHPTEVWHNECICNKQAFHWLKIYFQFQMSYVWFYVHEDHCHGSLSPTGLGFFLAQMVLYICCTLAEILFLRIRISDIVEAKKHKNKTGLSLWTLNRWLFLREKKSPSSKFEAGTGIELKTHLLKMTAEWS